MPAVGSDGVYSSNPSFGSSLMSDSDKVAVTRLKQQFSHRQSSSHTASAAEMYIIHTHVSLICKYCPINIHTASKLRHHAHCIAAYCSTDFSRGDDVIQDVPPAQSYSGSTPLTFVSQSSTGQLCDLDTPSTLTGI